MFIEFDTPYTQGYELFKTRVIYLRYHIIV